MRMRRVTSRANPVLKQFRRAASGKGLVLVEGPKLLDEALGAGVPIRHLAVGESARPEMEDLLGRCREAGAELILVPDKVLAAVTDVATNQGIVALAEPKLSDLDEIVLGETPLLVVAEAIQDPGNLGAMARSAAAFGADALVTLPGCADPFSPKAIRGAAGASFRLPVAKAGAEELIDWIRSRGISAAGLVARGGTPLQSFDFSKPCAIIIGNEGSGISPFLLSEVDILLRIPIGGEVESLNAAVAASIALFEASRRRRGSG